MGSISTEADEGRARIFFGLEGNLKVSKKY
jgi:hypothetical protein